VILLREALYEGDYFDLKVYLESKLDKKVEIVKLKKRADKGAFRCPYCDEILILKSGEVREEHFSHRHSKACEISTASEVYQKQIKRESRKHSLMKEIIYDELKSQEKLTTDLQVDYGFISKGKEKWKYYPDIVMNNKGKEVAITILTEVTSKQDGKLVKQIQKRNQYFQEKNLEPVWFVENAEQSIDMEHRVIHLWEAELDIAIKTSEDLRWEDTLSTLSLKASLFELFTYHHKHSPASYDIRSLYFVHSTDTNILFTVQRFILDEVDYPYRAFALNDAYQISLSTALQTKETLQLSDPKIEMQQREYFIQTIKQKEAEFIAKEQELKDSVEGATISSKLKKTAKFKVKVDVPTLNNTDIQEEIIAYVQHREEFTATEVSEYLVRERGASSATFSTGRYRIYLDVCGCLESLVVDGVLRFVKKDFVNDRIYKNVQADF